MKKKWLEPLIKNGLSYTYMCTHPSTTPPTHTLCHYAFLIKLPIPGRKKSYLIMLPVMALAKNSFEKLNQYLIVEEETLKKRVLGVQIVIVGSIDTNYMV
jgi:hypothetical protein